MIPEFEKKEIESLKIESNSRGYNWEFRLNAELLSLETIERADKIRNELEIKFPRATKTKMSVINDD